MFSPVTMCSAPFVVAPFSVTPSKPSADTDDPTTTSYLLTKLNTKINRELCSKRAVESEDDQEGDHEYERSQARWRRRLKMSDGERKVMLSPLKRRRKGSSGAEHAPVKPRGKVYLSEEVAIIHQ
jgi:hypothetical protein